MPSNLATGMLSKMTGKLEDVVKYGLPVGDESIELNPFVGKYLKLTFTGNISCKHCGNPTKKSFSQGYCFPCMRKLAQCDMCIMKPETCHFHRRNLQRAGMGGAKLLCSPLCLSIQYFRIKSGYHPPHSDPNPLD